MGVLRIAWRHIIVVILVFVFTVVLYSYTSNRPTHQRRLLSTVESLKSPSNVSDISYSQARQDRTVYDIFPKEHGFFVELGAFDGQQLSNTLWLERKHRWTGLLIEANPDLCVEIDKLKRQVWRLCGCISTQKSATFIQASELGGVEKHVHKSRKGLFSSWYKVTVPCYKLDKVMDQINAHHIDYFSLDVEGAELIVLETMQKELQSGKITVDIWTIEYRVWDGQKVVYEDSMNNLLRIRRFFKDVGGYVEHSQLSNDGDIRDGMALDVVFVNERTWCNTHGVLPNGSKCHVLLS